MKFGRDIIQNIEASRSREWLETNGLGGFASSTITGLNSRRYHGLLTAATKPPVGRVVLLSKLEETLVIDERRYELSANQYAGAVYPKGFDYQISFKLEPWPVFTYEAEGCRFEKSVFMQHGQNTTITYYKFETANEDRPASIKLEVRPLIAFRDYHSTTHENSALNPTVESEDGITSVRPYADLPFLHFAHDCAELESQGFWYRNFEYEVERERGLDFMEDLYSPLKLTFDLNRCSIARIIASTERHDIRDADTYRVAE
ncbi:MAG TPA: glycogen debranching enzyme N-terminal domain-containing protein, partial [Pyrinomonadaceae bacterium]